MIEIMQKNNVELWKNRESQKIMAESKNQQEVMKQWVRFADVVKYADDNRSTIGIDIGSIAKLKDKDWNTTLYMMEKGKGTKDTYYTLKYIKELDKFQSGIVYWKDLWGKFEKNMVNIANKYLTPQEADVILKKFEKQVKKQKTDKVLEQRILWK